MASKYQDKTVTTMTISMPELLEKIMTAKAKREKVSRSSLVVKAITEYYGLKERLEKA